MKLIRISAIWCPSCLIMEKVWQELKTEMPNIKYTSYDYDLDNECEIYEIGEILPVIILKQGEKELTRFIGEKTKQELIEGIKKYEKQ